jgi:hypothetical protein
MSDSAEKHLIHRSASGETQGLASEVEVADHWIRQGIGLMFRRRIGGDQALVFDFDSVDERNLGMLFVPFDIDCIWLVDGQVVQTERLEAWTGLAGARADRVVEVAPGTAETVHVGSEVQVISE